MIIDKIASLCSEISGLYKKNCTPDIMKKSVAFYDATTLDIRDSHQSVTEFTKQVLSRFPTIATICTSPRFIEDVGVALADSTIGITATIGAFPMGQTYIEVKMLECAMAIENGADEVDFVIDVAAANSGRWEEAKSEIEELINEIDREAISKVILECGSLNDLETIYKAATIALEAGADFIKTSTGKTDIGATLEYAVTICLAIREFYEKTGYKRGFKVSGGVRTMDDVAKYYTTVEYILGSEWLTANLFRIGTSSLVKMESEN